MSAIKQAVNDFLAPAARAGGGPADGTMDRAALLAELARVRRSREIWFWICAVALAVVFVLAVAYIVANRADPDVIKRMSTATGVTVIGAVAAMTKLLSDRTRSDLVFALVSGLSEEALRPVLLALVAKL
jgi:hypothetical protein